MIHVALVGFGGPESEDEVRPFIEGILAGRRASPGRVAEVAEQYAAVGNRSPYNDEARALAAALREALAKRGVDVDLRLACRSWTPRLEELARDWTAVPVVAVSLTPYGGGPDGDMNRRRWDEQPRSASVSWVDGWHAGPGLFTAWVDRLRHEGAEHLLLTAHSVPVRAAHPYSDRIQALAERVAGAAGRSADEWSLVWQSRSGRPEDPWLEPDVCDRIETLADEGVRSVAVAPLGFVFDHVEVLYDLGVEARAVAERRGLAFSRVLAPGTHPALVDDLASRIVAAAER